VSKPYFSKRPASLVAKSGKKLALGDGYPTRKRDALAASFDPGANQAIDSQSAKNVVNNSFIFSSFALSEYLPQRRKVRSIVISTEGKIFLR
jgi:hypothetical protein